MKEKVFVTIEPVAFALAGSPFECSGEPDGDAQELGAVELAEGTSGTNAATVLDTVRLCGSNESVSGRFVAALHRLSPP